MAGFLVQKNFQLNNIPGYILDEIKKYCKKKVNQESCGVIHLRDGELIFKECKNISLDPVNYFYIDPIILIDYDVQYIVHSHIIGSSKPSENDINGSNELCIPYLIYSLKDDDFYLYENVGV